MTVDRLFGDVLQQFPQTTALLKGGTGDNSLNQLPSLVAPEIVGYGGLRDQGTPKEMTNASPNSNGCTNGTTPHLKSTTVEVP